MSHNSKAGRIHTGFNHAIHHIFSRVTVPLICGLALLASIQTVRASNLTDTVVQSSGAGNYPTAALWKTNGTGTAVGPVAGNNYEMVTNGVLMANGLAAATCTTIRADNAVAWPGSTLTIDTNCQFKFKIGGTFTFTNAAGTNCLFLKGGLLDQGFVNSTVTIAGKIGVLSQSYLSGGSDGDGVGTNSTGPTYNAGAIINITGLLSGSGNLVLISCLTNIPQIINNSANTFSGQWIVKSGWLQGTNTGSLGTNSITVDPAYQGYTNDMPSVILVTNTPALFEPVYDLNSAGTLTLTNGGLMWLHQNCAFSAVTINGTSLSAGVYTYATLTNSYYANFIHAGSGSITVQPYNANWSPFPPVISTQPQNKFTFTGNTVTFSVAASGGTLSYQWYSSSSSTLPLANAVALADATKYSGTNTSTLTISNVTTSDFTNYAVIITNSSGSTTSSIASLANWPTPTLQLRMPFTNSDATDVSTTNAASDTSSGGINITMNMLTNGTVYGDLHGAAGTGITILDPNAQALDMTSNNVPSQGTNQPVQTTSDIVDLLGSTTLASLGGGGGNITNFVATVWAKMSTNAPFNGFIPGNSRGPRLWILNAGGSGLDLGGANTIGFQILSNNAVQLGYPGNTVNAYWPSGNIPVGQWLFFAMTYDGSNYKIYYGTDTSSVQLLTNTPASGQVVVLGSSASLQIGNRTSDFSRGFNGWMEDFRFYNNPGDSNFVESVRASVAPLPTVPVIVSQPQNVSVYPGQTATFSVTAGGTPPLAYQWQTNTVNVTDGGKFSGSATATLTVANVQFGDPTNYSVTITNAGGTTNSIVATLNILTPLPATNFTLNFGGTPIVEAQGTDWNTTNSWNPFGQAASLSAYAYAGSTYTVVVGSRLRTPLLGYAVFPGGTGTELVINGDGVYENGTTNPVTIGELRLKHNPFNPATNYFGHLVLNGGEVLNGDVGQLVLEGWLDVQANSVFYIDTNDGRSEQVDSWLTGTGNIFWHDATPPGGTNDFNVTGATNTFSGQWIVDQGGLLGSGAGSLGTNNIIVGTNGLTAAVETLYDVNNTNASLIIGANGEVYLHQNDHFASVSVNGTSLANGTYPFATLNSTYPANFPSSWAQQTGSTFTSGSGQIIVGNGSSSTPHITGIHVSGTTLSISATNGTAGGPWTLLQSTNVALPLSQWQTNIMGTFDGSGNLSTNILNTATNSQEFYILKVQ